MQLVIMGSIDFEGDREGAGQRFVSAVDGGRIQLFICRTSGGDARAAAAAAGPRRLFGFFNFFCALFCACLLFLGVCSFCQSFT